MIFQISVKEVVGIQRDAPKLTSTGHSFFTYGSNALQSDGKPPKPKSPLATYPHLNPHLNTRSYSNPPRPAALADFFAIPHKKPKAPLLRPPKIAIPVPVPFKILPSNIIIPFTMKGIKYRSDDQSKFLVKDI